MLTPGRIYPGSKVTLTAMFTDDNGVANDPTTVLFKTYSPCGRTITYTYGSSAEVTKTAVGSYKAIFYPSQAGRWAIRWETTGGVLVAEDSFNVQYSPFKDDCTRDYI